MYNFNLIEVKLKSMICQYKPDRLNTVRKLLTRLSKLLLKKFILNQLSKKLLLITEKPSNFKNHSHNIKLKNLFIENQFFRKELELRLSLDLEKKFIITLIFNLLYKEKMLMFNSIDKLINMFNQKKLQLLLNLKILIELKLFKYQEIKSLLNLLSKNMLNKEISITYKHHLLLEYLFIDLSQFLLQQLRKFLLSERYLSL